MFIRVQSPLLASLLAGANDFSLQDVRLSGTSLLLRDLCVLLVGVILRLSQDPVALGRVEIVISIGMRLGFKIEDLNVQSSWDVMGDRQNRIL